MKVVVHTFYTSDPVWEKIGGASAELTKIWANRHGYIHEVHKERVWKATPSITWEKIRILKESIPNHPDADWHIFIDADMYITNPSLSLEKILPNMERAMYVGSDWNFPLNTGFVCLSRKAIPVLDALKELRFSKAYGYFEQGTLEVIRELSDRWRKEVVPLEPRVCNSYPPNAREKWQGNWREGDFVVHFAGWQKTEVLDFLKPALDGSAELTEILVAARKEILARHTKDTKVVS